MFFNTAIHKIKEFDQKEGSDSDDDFHSQFNQHYSEDEEDLLKGFEERSTDNAYGIDLEKAIRKY